MDTNKIYYKRNLPHYQPEDSIFFITFRLAGSLPVQVIEKLKSDYDNSLHKIKGIIVEKEKHSKFLELRWSYFETFDSFLDKYKNDCWLQNTSVAKVVNDSILFHDKKEYNLISFTIMPNHVHMVFKLNTVVQDSSRSNNDKNLLSAPHSNIYTSDMNVALQLLPVTNILRLIKGATARECNKILNRTGAFWQHESYDHVVRNEEELNRIIEYVLYNPVQAKLTDDPLDWKWNYCKYL